MALNNTFCQYRGVSLGPVDFVSGAQITNVTVFGMLTTLQFVYHLPHVMQVQVFPPEGCMVPTTRSSSSDSLYSQAVCRPTSVKCAVSFGHCPLESASSLVWFRP